MTRVGSRGGRVVAGRVTTHRIYKCLRSPLTQGRPTILECLPRRSIECGMHAGGFGKR